MPDTRLRSAFTLIELLVVIAIIALLLSIIIPTTIRVKERARRAICQSNIRSFYIAVVAYAAGNDDFLPQGGSKGRDYIIVLDQTVYESLAGDADDSFVCPNLFNPYRGGNVNVFDEGSYLNEIDSRLLGYNYLGGIQNTPWPLKYPAEVEWSSPHKITDNSRLPLITELNSWVFGNYRMTFAPHGCWGPIHESKDSTNASYNGIASDAIGAVGGNICTLDGTVSWKDIEDMDIHRGALEPSIDLFAYW